jgi:hypothetical protein
MSYLLIFAAGFACGCVYAVYRTHNDRIRAEKESYDLRNRRFK